MRPRELIEESGARPDVKAVEVLCDIRELLNKQVAILTKMEKEIGSLEIGKKAEKNHIIRMRGRSDMWA